MIHNINLFFKKYFIFFAIGAITAFSQAPFNISLFSVIGFSALFYLINIKDNISIFWAGHLFGFGYFLVGLYWIGNALLTDATQFAFFIPFAYLGLPFALAFFYAIALWLFEKITHYLVGKNKDYIFYKYLMFISILALFDYLRGHIFTGFPWNLPVYTTISMPLFMQPSYFLGIYVYNFVWLLLVGSFGLYFLKVHFKKWVLFSVQTILITSITLYGYWHIHYDNQINHLTSDDKKTIIRIIQPNIQQKLKWSAEEATHNFNQLLSLSGTDLNPDYHYIFIWPETALPFNPEHDFAAASRITDLLDNKHTLITGKMRFIEKNITKGEYEFYNSIFKISADGNIESVFDKVHLVPFGEYLPLRFILSRIGFSQVNFFKSEFSSGKNFTPFMLDNNLKAGGLICYEAIFPEYSNIIKKNHANIIINLTNDAWFGNSFGPYQHLVQTQFRAVENNIPIIRSANTGISSFIDNKGMIIKSLGINKAGFIDIDSVNLVKKSGFLK